MKGDTGSFPFAEAGSCRQARLVHPFNPSSTMFVDLTSSKCSVSLELICKMGIMLPMSAGEQGVRCHRKGAALPTAPARETATGSVLIWKLRELSTYH